MNRRGFIATLLKATAAATVAYSFPSIIVPKNIVPATLTWFETPIYDSSGLPLADLFMPENSVLLIPRVWMDTALKLVGQQVYLPPLELRSPLQ